MPSENRRRKDDTWTQDELNKALKGSKDDRRHGEGDRRSHGDRSEKRRHKDEGEEKQRHRRREHSPEVQLTETEEERERMRRERREKKEKGKEKPRQKEMKLKSREEDDDDDDDRNRRRHHRKEEDDRRERKSHKEDDSRRHREDRHREDESSGHRDDRHKERQHHESDRDRDREREKRHRKDEEDERSHRKEKESSSRRHHRDNDEESRHHERERRHHNDDGDERRQHRDKESKSRHRKDDDEKHHGDDDDRHRRHQNGSDRRKHRENDEKKHRGDDEEEKEEERRQRRAQREREKQKEREERDRKAETKKPDPPTPSFSVNGKNKEEDEPQADDDYNYEEDFEDYEDDFEDQEDPEMKEDGEMEEVLRALDEENNRLQSNSRRSNWSDSTELSDERFKESKEDEPKNKSQGKSFINFISAKQRVMDHTIASKARKRFTDLSKLIELDVAGYDMFDLPPVGEYELYIRNFGRSDTKQAYVQTGDDNVEREVQTEETDSLTKWTQHPSHQEAVVGGEGISVASPGDVGQMSSASDNVRLEQFLERVGKYLFVILDEESTPTEEEVRIKDAKPLASFSQTSSKLGFPNFLEGRQVNALSFCPSDPNFLLSVHTHPFEKSQEEDVPLSFDSLYVLCVWKLSQMAYPYRVCVSEMVMTCACFSPTRASLVFAGMNDGSLSLWDLREGSSQHKSLDHKGQSHVVRHATYMTAGVLENENHKSPVKAISAVHSAIVGSLRNEDTSESSSGLSFQLASVEEKAVINLWVVAEIAAPDPAGSENDLGLSPGGKIKLIRSSSIVLNNPDKYLSYSQELRALDLHLNPADLNHLYVATDAGCVVHGVRFGKRVFPPAYTPSIASPVAIVTIDFSPFGQPYFLAGCEDGTLYLFHTRSEYPIATWREFVTGEAILSVRWSRSRPAVFFVLDNNSTILTFDLVENGLAPLKTDNIRTADATCMEVGSDPNLLTPGANHPAQMVVALDNGTIECLAMSDQMRKQQPLEEDFLASYIDRY